jgi:hypothetical protein
MKQLTLDEFIAAKDGTVCCGHDRAWVKEDGFGSLYVRKVRRYFRVDGKPKICTNVFELATIDAERPGNGAFTRLVEKLERVWDGPIFVESVLSERFAAALVRMGFVPVYPEGNFVKHLDKGKGRESTEET